MFYPLSWDWTINCTPLMRLLAPLLPLLNSALCIISYREYRSKPLHTLLIEITLIMFLQQVYRRMVITFYKVMIDFQLHKINYKTPLECFFVWWGIALLVPTNTFFLKRYALSGYPLRFAASAICIPCYLSH